MSFFTQEGYSQACGKGIYLFNLHFGLNKIRDQLFCCDCLAVSTATQLNTATIANRGTIKSKKLYHVHPLVLGRAGWLIKRS